MWVRKVDDIAMRYQWSDTDILRVGSSQLREPSRYRYELTRLNTSQTQIKNGITKEISHCNSVFAFGKRSCELRNKNKTSLGRLLLPKVSKVQMSEENLIDAIFGGTALHNARISQF